MIKLLPITLLLWHSVSRDTCFSNGNFYIRANGKVVDVVDVALELRKIDSQMPDKTVEDLAKKKSAKDRLVEIIKFNHCDK